MIKSYLPSDVFAQVVDNTPLIAIDLVVTDKNRILVGKRKNKPAQGTYFVPGGRICKEEPFDFAFARISNDELGVCLGRPDCELLGIYDHMYPDSAVSDDISTHYVVIAYHVEIPEEKLDERCLADQHESFEMIPLQEALSRPDVHVNTQVYVHQLLCDDSLAG